MLEPPFCGYSRRVNLIPLPPSSGPGLRTVGARAGKSGVRTRRTLPSPPLRFSARLFISARRRPTSSQCACALPHPRRRFAQIGLCGVSFSIKKRTDAFSGRLLTYFLFIHHPRYIYLENSYGVYICGLFPFFLLTITL